MSKPSIISKLLAFVERQKKLQRLYESQSRASDMVARMKAREQENEKQQRTEAAKLTFDDIIRGYKNV